MSAEAATKALLDAGLTYDDIQHAFVGYCYGDSCSGQSALYALGLTGIPITNVNNNCSTGSTALFHANTYVKAGIVDCSLALGFERMRPGSLGSNWTDRKPPLAHFDEISRKIEEQQGTNVGPSAPRMFSNGVQEYFDKYGATKEHLAMIAAKNHAHSVSNPYSQFRDGWSKEQVLKSPQITKQLTKLMCCPTSDGAACCIVASEAFVKAHKLQNQAIEIVAQAFTTDGPRSFESKSAMELVGYGMTQRCADEVFAQAGFGIGQGRDLVGVIELHDCFAANELITYDALRLCKPGEAHKLVEARNYTYGGTYVVNPSGGLEAKGHPLGATGLAMYFYVTTQLRNWAGPMQAPNLFNTPDKQGKFGLVHNIGLGGAAVVSLLRRPEFWEEGGPDGRDRLGYNHAHEARSISLADLRKVMSKHHSDALLHRSKL